MDWNTLGLKLGHIITQSLLYQLSAHLLSTVPSFTQILAAITRSGCKRPVVCMLITYVLQVCAQISYQTRSGSACDLTLPPPFPHHHKAWITPIWIQSCITMRRIYSLVSQSPWLTKCCMDSLRIIIKTT